MDPIATAPLWLQILLAALASLVMLFVLPWLKRKAEEAKAKAAEADLSARDMLIEQVKAFCWDEATSIAEQKFPKLAKKVSEEGWKSGSIKKELGTWGEELRSSVKAYFAGQGIDLAGVVADEYLDKFIRYAADKVSPFPGKDTAAALLEKDWSNKLVAYGVKWVREHYLESE